MQRLITSFLCACAILAALTASGAVKGSLTKKGGEKLEGYIEWDTRNKEYKFYATKDLKSSTGYPPKDVVELDIEKPAKFDDAVDQVAKGQGAAAVPVLEKIVKDYAHLQWDKTAGRYLAEAYIAAGKPTDALKVCTDIIDGEPSAAYRGDLAPAYWNALLGLGRTKQLETNLGRALKSGDRFSRGAALLMRGDIVMKDGNESAEACKQALTDGYLRVVYLYKDEGIAEKLRPEALYKAARCFEKLGLGTPATTMREELRSSYAESPWANR